MNTLSTVAFACEASLPTFFYPLLIWANIVNNHQMSATFAIFWLIMALQSFALLHIVKSQAVDCLVSSTFSFRLYEGKLLCLCTWLKEFKGEW